jgi:hypothetical protein
MCRIAAIGCPDLLVNPDRRRPVRLQDDCESVVILGMGIRLGNRGGDVDAARLSAGISHL